MFLVFIIITIYLKVKVFSIIVKKISGSEEYHNLIPSKPHNMINLLLLLMMISI